MKILHNKKFWSILFYIWIIGLYVLTSMTFSPDKEPSRETGIRFDYIEHFVLYAVIPVLYYLARGAYLNKIIKDPYYILLLGILFSILTEIQQYYIPGRSFNPVDLILNLAGFTTGIFLGKILKKRFIKS